MRLPLAAPSAPACRGMKQSRSWVDKAQAERIAERQAYLLKQNDASKGSSEYLRTKIAGALEALVEGKESGPSESTSCPKVAQQ